MDTKTVFLILLAAIVSIAVVLFQYFHRNKRNARLSILLSVLRFIFIFSGLLLLINPKFTKDNFYVEKSKLWVLVDDSSSMSDTTKSQDAQQYANAIIDNAAIEERFEVFQYGFGTDFYQTDFLNFTGTGTNINHALRQIAELNGSDNGVVILVSDGNQTVGNDYQYAKFSQAIEIHPIVVGDTTKYQDVSVSRIDLNKYAFLGNQFPIEATLNYQGNSTVFVPAHILMDGVQIHRENLNLSKNSNSKTIQTLVTARKVGTKEITVEIGELSNEKNTTNNRRETAIEVIDEKTQVLLISDFLHPDIGAFKKSIEANQQRSVVYADVNKAGNFDEIDIAIFYQPTSNFEKVYQEIETRTIPIILVTGTQTDLNFVNKMNRNRFSLELGYPEQEVFGVVNPAFPHFDVSNFNLSGYPPLLSDAGPLTMIEEPVILVNMEIKGVQMDSPLMAIWNDGQTKQVVLFGENIWQWRAHSFRDHGSFEHFDDFMGKLMLYLSQSGRRERLELDYDRVYDGATEAKIRASFFDKTFVLDGDAALSLRITNEANGTSQELPMLFKGSYHEATLTNLIHGSYRFTVTETAENISKSGTFKILGFDAEKQFFSSDYERLSRLASNNGGIVYYSDKLDMLIENLQTGDRYVPIQKNRQKVVSLVDFKVLLAMMALALATEWFIRKYNGLL